MTDAKKPLVVDCPHCQKPVTWIAANNFRPFCSKRCRLIDLGDWADERNVISGNDDESDVLSGDLGDEY